MKYFLKRFRIKIIERSKVNKLFDEWMVALIRTLYKRKRGLDVSKVFYKSNFRDCHKISFMINISVGSIRKYSLSKIPLLRSVLPYFWIQILEYHSSNRAVFNHNTLHWRRRLTAVFCLLFTNIMIKAWFKIYPGNNFLKCSPRLGCKMALF